MPIKPRELESLLQSKFGFVESDTHGSDHRNYKLTMPNVPFVYTKVSHSKKEIGRALEAKIARQLRVRKAFFDEMFSCTKSCAEYYAQIKTDPFPPFT